MHIRIARRLPPAWSIGLGLALLAPGALFVFANLLNELGVGVLMPAVEGLLSVEFLRLVSPLVFLGGLAGALVLNVLAILELDVRWESRRLVSTVIIEARWPHVAMIATAALPLATLLAYGVVENFAIVSTHAG